MSNTAAPYGMTKIVLSATEVQIARELGMPLGDYARMKLGYTEAAETLQNAQDDVRISAVGKFGFGGRR